MWSDYKSNIHMPVPARSFCGLCSLLEFQNMPNMHELYFTLHEAQINFHFSIAPHFTITLYISWNTDNVICSLCMKHCLVSMLFKEIQNSSQCEQHYNSTVVFATERNWTETLQVKRMTIVNALFYISSMN